MTFPKSLLASWFRLPSIRSAGRSGAGISRSHWMLMLLVSWVVGCQTQQDQRDFESRAIAAPEGITVTDIHGQTADGATDPDDWRSSPFYDGIIDVSPARPNPVLASETVIIELLMDLDTRVSQLQARVLHDNGDTPPLDEISGSPITPGQYELRFPASSLTRTVSPQGLYRVLIYDGNYQIVSYGDVEVE